jgi:hypothetical protein
VPTRPVPGQLRHDDRPAPRLDALVQAALVAVDLFGESVALRDELFEPSVGCGLLRRELVASRLDLGLSRTELGLQLFQPLLELADLVEKPKGFLLVPFEGPVSRSCNRLERARFSSADSSSRLSSRRISRRRLRVLSTSDSRAAAGASTSSSNGAKPPTCWCASRMSVSSFCSSRKEMRVFSVMILTSGVGSRAVGRRRPLSLEGLA